MTLKTGTYVLVTPTAPSLTTSYPAAAWLTEDALVVLAEDAPNQGTLDMIEVYVDATAVIQPIYDFNIVRKAEETEVL